MEIGKIQTLEVVREKDFGVFLAEPGKKRDGREDSVLLPKKTGSGGNEDRGLPGSVPL